MVITLTDPGELFKFPLTVPYLAPTTRCVLLKSMLKPKLSSVLGVESKYIAFCEAS